ncbi:hypothetical protein AYK24_05700 [Thermoplasmatales archaeon SG8-52-4]|nr:MAG: hypothetical protein AYK24_05700 [Thermoplasmatales archaeon SG8-52-4]
MDRLRDTCFNEKEIISASEIGQYHYCSIAWYLQRCGYQPKSEMLNIGIKKHMEMGKIIDYTQLSNKKSRILARIGYFCLVIGLLIFLLGVII